MERTKVAERLVMVDTAILMEEKQASLHDVAGRLKVPS